MQETMINNNIKMFLQENNQDIKSERRSEVKVD